MENKSFTQSIPEYIKEKKYTDFERDYGIYNHQVGDSTVKITDKIVADPKTEFVIMNPKSE